MQNPGFFPLFFRWLLFISWALLMTWLSLIPSPPQIELTFFGWDKFGHAAAYGVFTMLAAWAFTYFPRAAQRRWTIAIVTAVLFGGLLEIAQGLFTKTRRAEWGDLLADLVGAGCAYLAIRIVRSVLNRRNRSEK